MNFINYLLEILKVDQVFPEEMTSEILFIIGSYMEPHPTAKIISTMSALTMHAVKDDYPGRPLGQKLERMDLSVFNELKKFKAFEEHCGDIGFNITYVDHLIGYKTLKHDNTVDNPGGNKEANRLRKALKSVKPWRAWKAWEEWKTFKANNGEKNLVASIIYQEFHEDQWKLKEWKEMHPAAKLCPKV